MPAIVAVLVAAGCEEPFGPVVDPVYSIDLRYWGSEPSAAQKFRIESAVARWEGLITRGLPSSLVTGDAGCGPGSPAMDEEVDDLVVFVRVIDIDALAESGPCRIREAGGLPITATVWLDGPGRLDQLNLDFLESLVTHELGHALGFGTVWDARALLEEPSLEGGIDPYFAGPNAVFEFNAAGGLSVRGNKVPLESAGGEGTADSHWRQTTFGTELMTPTLDPGPNPLSRITAASMVDVGYEVDLDAADEYRLPGTSSRVAPDRGPAGVAPVGGSAELPPFTESVPRWSLTVIDRGGSIVRTLRRR